jgi:hypothetical protein
MDLEKFLCDQRAIRLYYLAAREHTSPATRPTLREAPLSTLVGLRKHFRPARGDFLHRAR